MDVVLVCHDREFLKDPFQIRIRVFAEDPAVLDHGVEHGTAPACFLAADKQPVFCTYLGRTHSALNRVIVDVDFPMVEVDDEFAPLV